MRKNDFVKKMSAQKLIFDEPIMSGEYVWRDKGIKLVNNVFEVFIKKLSLENKVDILKCGNFVDKDSYFDLYHQINDYKNIFMAVDKNFIIRPEITCGMTQFFKKSDSSNLIAINAPLYRQFKTKAFLIDQRIWPAISFCALISKKNTLTQIEKLVTLINNFYDSFLLPRIWVEQSSGFKKFADLMLLPLMPENQKQLTVLSTFYVLSRKFSEKLGITHQNIIQFGFSERIIATYIKFQENRQDVIWPSDFSPTQVIVCSSLENKFKRYLHFTQIRFKFYNFKPYFKRTEKDILKNDVIKQGVPLIIFPFGDQVFYCLPVNSEIGLFSHFSIISTLLQKSDKIIFKNNIEYFEECLLENKIVFLCNKCLNKESGLVSIGNVYPKCLGICQNCNANNTPKKVLVPTHAKSTINEKLKK